MSCLFQDRVRRVSGLTTCEKRHFLQNEVYSFVAQNAGELLLCVCCEYARAVANITGHKSTRSVCRVTCSYLVVWRRSIFERIDSNLTS